MRLRTLYALNGAVWGLLIGLGLGIQLFAMAAGFSWIFLFGDDNWPEMAAWYLTALPAIVAFAGFTLCIVFGYLYGRRREGAEKPEVARRVGRLALVMGLLIWMLVGGGVMAIGHQQQAERDLALTREAALTHLMTTRRIVTDVVPSTLPDGRVRLRIETAGTRNGAYRFAWRLREPLYRVILSGGEAEVELTFTDSAMEIELDAAAVARRYREEVLNDTPGRVLVDQDFILQVFLEPRLDERERATLPPRELGNLDRGLSGLRSESRFEVPMRFEITTGANQ